MEHMGIDPGRIHYSWISSAESTKFVDVAKAVTEAVKSLGPNVRFIRNEAKDVKVAATGVMAS